MIYTFRNVALNYLGKAIGIDDAGNPVPVLVPCFRGDKQLGLVNIGVEFEDAAWSAAVLTLKQAPSLTADWVDLSPSVTIAVGDKDKEPIEVEFAYFGVQVTTANVAASSVTLVITTSEV